MKQQTGSLLGQRLHRRAGCLLIGIGMLLAVAWPSGAGTLTVPWFVIAGGGGSSSNAQFSVSGTVGDVSASTNMTAGSFTVVGGFWQRVLSDPTAAAAARRACG